MMLAETFTLLEEQKNGEDGALIKDEYANIFYIRDIEGIPRVVYCRWTKCGWFIDAFPINKIGKWREGDQVFFRNPMRSQD